MKKTVIAKWMLCFVILVFAGVGAKNIFFPKKPANIISDEEKALLEDLGIGVASNDGGDVSPAFGMIDLESATESSGSALLFDANAEAPAFTATAAPPFASNVDVQDEAPPFTQASPFAATKAPAFEPVAASAHENTTDASASPFNVQPAIAPLPVSEPATAPQASTPLPPLSHHDALNTASPFAPASEQEPANGTALRTFSSTETTPLVTSTPQVAKIKPLPYIAEPLKANPAPPIQESVPLLAAAPTPESTSSPPLSEAANTRINPIRPETGVSAFQPVSDLLPSNAPIPGEYQRTSIRSEDPIPVATSPGSNRFRDFNSTHVSPLTSATPVVENSAAAPPFPVAAATPIISAEATPAAQPQIPLLSFETGSRPAAPQIEAIQITPPQLRETVVQFVKAQCVLIDSGSAKAIREGYSQLSQLYNHPELNDDERQYMTPILNQLARDVVFTPNIHVLELPYRVGQADTIESVAAQFDLSPMTLMRINGMTHPKPLQPGSELKVVYGPFDVRVNRSRNELLLVLNGLYAGCYRIGVGTPLAGQSGDLPVIEKRLVGANNDIHWVDLGQGKGIVSSYDLTQANPNPLILVPQKEMTELYDLLTSKSTVTLE